MGAAVGASIGLLAAFFTLRDVDMNARDMTAGVTKFVLLGVILGALVGAASNWRR